MRETKRTKTSILGSLAKPNGIGPINPPNPNFTFSFFAERITPMNIKRKPIKMSKKPDLSSIFSINFRLIEKLIKI